MSEAPHVLITGASRGIGRATALALAARGAELTLLGRSSALLDSVVIEARALSERQVRSATVGARPRIVSIPCDLREPSEIEAAAACAVRAVGPPHAILHNAAVIERVRLEELTLESFQHQLDVNLRAPFLLTRALLPGLRELGRGRIVFVGSIASTVGTATTAAYCASKWGLVGFMKSLAEELKDSGISTVCVLPGSVDTEMLKGSGFPPRMTAEDVAKTLVHYTLDAPPAHNGGVIEMFGV